MDRVAPYELPLGDAAESVSKARRFFADIARDRLLPRAVRDAGALVVSELVTNALIHGRAPITLRVTAMPRTLRVAVTDASDQPPALRRRAPHRPIARDRGSANNGRGLAIVAGVADQWGCEPSVQRPGKTVWCNLTIPLPDGS